MKSHAWLEELVEPPQIYIGYSAISMHDKVSHRIHNMAQVDSRVFMNIV